MYVRQTCNVDLAGVYRLRGLHACEVKKSVHQIVQTARLELPMSVLFRNGELQERIKLIDKIKEGDPVQIDLGYNGNNRTEFIGYISRIDAKMPVVLECEDEMYLFRNTWYKKSFKKASLKEVLKFLIQGVFDRTGVNFELYDKMPELTLTNFMLNDANGIQALQDISDKYGISSYLTYINGKRILYCGLLYGLKRDQVKFQLQRNTINVDELKYQVNKQIAYLVKAVLHKPNGQVEEYSFGKKGDQERKLHFYGSYSKSELQSMCEAELAKFSNAGFKGSFQTFLIPNTKPGDYASIEDLQFGRSGNYFIGTVTTTFGSGARRTNEIDMSLS